MPVFTRQSSMVFLSKDIGSDLGLGHSSRIKCFSICLYVYALIFPPNHMCFKLLRKTRSNGFLKKTWFSYITHKHKCVNGFLLSIE